MKVGDGETNGATFQEVQYKEMPSDIKTEENDLSHDP